MASIESFRTKRGTAHFTEDAVQFEEPFSGYVRSLYREYWQDGNWWHSGTFVGYVLAFPVRFWWVVSAVRGGDVLLLAVIAGLTRVGSDRRTGFDSTPSRKSLQQMVRGD